MSHAYGQVRFTDGLILHFEYNGTADFCIPSLRDTAKEVSDHWRKDDGPTACTCGKEPEAVVIANDYGGGGWWYGGACRTCRVIVHGLMSPWDGEQLYMPSWWQKEESCFPRKN